MLIEKERFKREEEQDKEERDIKQKLDSCGGPIKTSYLSSNILSKLLFCWPTKLIRVS